MEIQMYVMTENAEPSIAGEANLALNDNHCRRCGGFMINEHCTDLLDETGRMEFPAVRCLQCGDVVDAVILLNRSRKPDTVSRRPTKWDTRHRGTNSVH